MNWLMNVDKYSELMDQIDRHCQKVNSEILSQNYYQNGC